MVYVILSFITKYLDGNMVLPNYLYAIKLDKENFQKLISDRIRNRQLIAAGNKLYEC